MNLKELNEQTFNSCAFQSTTKADTITVAEENSLLIMICELSCVIHEILARRPI
jgi:hypothetical protein